MFREVARKKQQISREECIEILKNEKRGVLSVCGDDGYPYGMPMNHFYCEENGRIYFHSGKHGHKVDAIKENDKVSFCVYDEGVRPEGEWALRFKSVIVFGRIREVKEDKRIRDIVRQLCAKFTFDTEYIEYEIQNSGPNTLYLELTPEHMTGKMVTEA